ncbi:MAG: thermonuclease family protein [Syntrophaceae bacterium]|nr:thermonuclease family protein [Syntrophaceae bacterium]
MRRSLKFGFPLLLFILPAIALVRQFKVTPVYEGENLTARGHDIEIKVRLVVIDAPETSKSKRDPGQPYSQQSKKYLTVLVLNKTVEFEGYGQDRYGIILGLVTCNGKNISQTQP